MGVVNASNLRTLSHVATALCMTLVLPACGSSHGGPDAGSAGSSRGATDSSSDNGGRNEEGGTGSSTDGEAAVPPETSDTLPSLLGDVTYSHPSQTFKGELTITLETAIEGAEIRYTTDGSLPSADSSLFDGNPLTLTQTTQLRAQAFVKGAASGRVSTALYVARSFDFTSTLPIVVVDGYGAGKPRDKNVYFDAAVMVFAPENGQATFAALPTIATRAGYHVRGQSSARFPKTPYRLEFWDNEDEDADYPVLGMPAQSDWALISPYYDRTLIRNPFAYELGRDMGLEAPRTAFVEVFLSYEGGVLEESDYQGIYWFTETIKNAKGRTNLKQLEPDDTSLPEISGGYIFKFDQAAAEEPKLTCVGSPPLPSFGFGGPGGFGGQGGAPTGTCWVDLEVVDPNPLNDPQKAWLTQYIQAFHDSLHQSPIGNYAEYIDVGSFVDYLIINELSRNVDAYVRSAYFHKDRDGKLRAGPLWDYNFGWALGGQTSIDPNGPFQYDGSRNVNNWYPRLTKDPAFMDAVRTRWRELRSGLLSDEALLSRVDQLAAQIQEAIPREYARWPVAQIYANPGIVRGSTAPDWETQLQVMKDFLVRRAAKMDSVY